METLKVGDLRQWKNDKRVFEILYVGTEKAVHRYINGEKSSHGHIELMDSVHYILNASIPYQEPKPVRKLVAYRYIETGEIRFFDKEQYHLHKFDKLSDDEMKELFSFMKDEK